MIGFMNNETKKEFYARCGEILGIEHDWQEPVPRRTRWNTRNLGNGRFPGFGLVQMFGPASIRVVSKAGTKMFTTAEAVYEYLETKKAAEGA